MILAVIPARGGSKGVRRKNIRPVLGKPLIAYTIECAHRCKSLDATIVTTEDPEIARIARDFGAFVPFMRPPELAEDTTPMMPVLQHSVTEFERLGGKSVSILVLLDPTAPLRKVEDIEDALRLFRSHRCEALVSGSPAHRNPYFNMVTRDNGFIRLVNASERSIGRRQDAPPVFDLNTVVWIYSRTAVMDQGIRLPRETILYLTPRERSIDLDSEYDFELLDFILSRVGAEGKYAE